MSCEAGEGLGRMYRAALRDELPNGSNPGDRQIVTSGRVVDDWNTFVRGSAALVLWAKANDRPDVVAQEVTDVRVLYARWKPRAA